MKPRQCCVYGCAMYAMNRHVGLRRIVRLCNKHEEMANDCGLTSPNELEVFLGMIANFGEDTVRFCFDR